MEKKTGTVKFFNPANGFGFVVPDVPNADGKDDFLHAKALTKSGLKDDEGRPHIEKGEKVEYVMEYQKGRPVVGTLTIIPATAEGNRPTH